MSETIDFRVFLNIPLLKVPARERFEAMGMEVTRRLADMRETKPSIYSYYSSNTNRTEQTNRLFQTKQKTEPAPPQRSLCDIFFQKLIPVKVKPMSLPGISTKLTPKKKVKTESHDNTEKLVAVAKSLETPKLSDLRSDVEQKMPELEKVVEKAARFLKNSKKGNSKRQIKEFNKHYEKLLQIIRTKDNELQKQENHITSELLKQTLKETGFESIRQKTKKNGSAVIRAGNEENFTSIFAEIDARKGITLDTKGFKEESCKKVVDSVVAKLEEKGVKVVVQERRYHGSVEGGNTVQKFEPLFNPLAVPLKKEVKQKKEKEQAQRKRFRLLNRRMVK